MKNIFIGFALLFLASCSTEEGTRTYTTAIRNTSDKPVHILVLGNGENRNTLVYDTLVNTTLKSGEITFKNTYKFPSFHGMHNGTYFIDIYYTKIKFIENNKGYICKLEEDTELCTSNKNGLPNARSTNDFTLENGVYYYDITQTDYENAHVLP